MFNVSCNFSEENLPCELLADRGTSFTSILGLRKEADLMLSLGTKLFMSG